MLSGTCNAVTSGPQTSFKIRYYSSSFHPAENDVVISKGTKWYRHSGNRRLRKLVASKLDEYLAATKSEKSYILLEILSQLRMHDVPKPSKKNRFVKFDKSAGLWMEVSDVQANEKVSQAFRDELHQYYKSSSTSRRKRKRERKNTAPSNATGRTLRKHPLIEPVQFGIDNDELLQTMSSILHLNEDSNSWLSLNMASTSRSMSACKRKCERDNIDPNNLTSSTLGKHPQIEALQFGMDNDKLLQTLSSSLHLNEDSSRCLTRNMPSTSSCMSKCKRKHEGENIATNNTAERTLGKHPMVEPMQFGMENDELLQSMSSILHFMKDSSNCFSQNTASKLPVFLPQSSILAQWFDNDINKKTDDDDSLFDDLKEFVLDPFLLG